MAHPATIAIGGDITVDRMGFGALHIVGAGASSFGAPRDRAGAIALLRRVVERGARLIDTADSYGPYVSESLIAEALHPYPAGLAIAT
ncbi:MAG TPA: aldo/keto reductase, partial [Stellaceae bacterium]|nr:aldo/keto reductase [Stellaceae bacterium]